MPVRRTDLRLRIFTGILSTALAAWAVSACGVQQAAEAANTLLSDNSNPALERSDPFRIDEAKWTAEDARLEVRGKGSNGATVVLSNADTLIVLGQIDVDDDEWTFRESGFGAVPCRIRAEQSDGQVAEMAVRDAPLDCAGNTVGGQPEGNDIALLGANDLWMHCADLDYQIFSILTPFNVVHAQAIRKGSSDSLPRILDNAEVAVT
jgi:hypothetical protein